MKRTITVVLALIVNISSTFAADNLSSVNWLTDNDSLPEILPKKMRGKSDDEIQTAVFQAYENQLKVISEYSGHVFDPEFPLGFFKDEMPISNARTSNPLSDLIFYNNGIRGFIGFKKNSIIIKWVPNQVVTEIEWKELSVRGRYTFLNSTFFNQGKYLIQLQDVKYLASTPLSENIEAYPSTVSKTSISYNSVKASFTGGLPDVLKTSDSPNLKHFLEDIVFQQVADRVVKDTHNNITAAIRQVVKPYIIFKNITDPHFPSINGKLSGGLSVGYSISNTVINGLDNIEQKLKKITTKMSTNTVMADQRITIHSLNGVFEFKIDESKPIAGKASFTIGRIDVNVSFNMLKPAECKAEVTVNQPVVKYGMKLSSVDHEKVLSTSFVDNVKNHLNTVCKAIDEMFKPGK